MLFKLQIHYNYKTVGKRFTGILICHECTASPPLSSVPFCRVLGKCQSRLPKKKKNIFYGLQWESIIYPVLKRVCSRAWNQITPSVCTHVYMQVWRGEVTEEVGSLWRYHTMQNMLSILMVKVVSPFLPKSEYAFLVWGRTALLYLKS